MIGQRQIVDPPALEVDRTLHSRCVNQDTGVLAQNTGQRPDPVGCGCSNNLRSTGGRFNGRGHAVACSLVGCRSIGLLNHFILVGHVREKLFHQQRPAEQDDSGEQHRHDDIALVVHYFVPLSAICCK